MHVLHVCVINKKVDIRTCGVFIGYTSTKANPSKSNIFIPVVIEVIFWWRCMLGSSLLTIHLYKTELVPCLGSSLLTIHLYKTELAPCLGSSLLTIHLYKTELAPCLGSSLLTIHLYKTELVPCHCERRHWSLQMLLICVVTDNFLFICIEFI